MIEFINKQKSIISSLANGNPSKKIKVIGVTGTRGKTIVAHMLYHIFKEAGERVGLISSLGYTVDMENFNDGVTANTVNSSDIPRLLSQMMKNGLNYAIVEFTSANLRHKNYEGITLDSGIITNILWDNPVFYKEWPNYAMTKFDFINKIKNDGLLVIHNHHSDVSNWIQNNGKQVKPRVFLYWTDNSHLKDVSYSTENTRFNLENDEYNVPFIGRTNIVNAMQAIKLAQAYVHKDKVKSALQTFKTPAGRMEVVQNKPFTVIVDYAYTPEMIEEALQYLNIIKQPRGKIITVIGSSGEQAINRRTVAAIAAKYSAMVVLGAEDPRSERVSDINTELHLKAQPFRAMLVERISSTEEYRLLNKINLKTKIERVWNNGDIAFIAFDADDYTSRYDAINFAIKSASPQDIIYITGKGHENTLSFNKVEYEWSDSEAARQALGVSQNMQNDSNNFTQSAAINRHVDQSLTSNIPTQRSQLTAFEY